MLVSRDSIKDTDFVRVRTRFRRNDHVLRKYGDSAAIFGVCGGVYELHV
jgi:hypothetical protein